MEQQCYSLCGGTERRWLSKTEATVPPGFNFTPTDQQLINHYLRPYALAGAISLEWDHIVEERVYEKEPCELLDDADRDVRYFFANRTECRLAGGRMRRTMGQGTWTGKAKSEIVSADGETIGFRAMLLYCVDGKSHGYTMYEYELHQSVTNNFMQEEGAQTLHERVLCCVKKSAQKIAGSKRRRAEAAAATKAAIVSSKRDRHDGAFEVGGEYPACNSSAAVVAAASYNTMPSSMLAAEYKATSPMHLPTAAEASLERRPSSSAVDQLPPACSGSYWTEEMINAVISDTSEEYELEMTAAEVVTTALPPPSGQDGDQPTASAIYTGHLGWLSNFRYSPPRLPIDMEMPPPMNLLPLFNSELSSSSDHLKSPPESVLPGVANLAAANCSATPPIVAEASLEGRVNTETIKLASTDQIMSPSAADQQPPANNNSYRMEEMINTDISDTCEGYELEMTTAEHHLPPPFCQDGDQPTASAIFTGQNLTYSPLLPPPPDLLPQFEWQMPPPPDLLPQFDWEMPPPPDLLPQFDWEMPQPPDLLPPFDWEMLPPWDLLPPFDWEMPPPSDLLKSPPESAPAGVTTSTAADCSAMPLMYAADCSATPPMYLSAAAEASLEGGVHTETIELASTDQIMSSSAIDQQPPAYNDSYRTEEMINADISDTCEGYELEMITAEVVATAEHHLPPPW